MMHYEDRVTEIQHAVLSEVRERFGIAFTETHTGGGCMGLEARLESGHWIVAVDEGLMGFRERIAYELNENCASGWSVGIYPNSRDHGEDWWGGEDSIVDVVDYDAHADGLATVVGRALSQIGATK